MDNPGSSRLYDLDISSRFWDLDHPPARARRRYGGLGGQALHPSCPGGSLVACLALYGVEYKLLDKRNSSSPIQYSYDLYSTSMPAIMTYWNCVIRARAPVRIFRSSARSGDELSNRTVTIRMDPSASWGHLHDVQPKETRKVRPIPTKGNCISRQLTVSIPVQS